jgi:glycosyltransferase involved in cell wall biosynthesis
MIDRLGVYGCPSFYGGADTELADQMYIWHKMGIQLHIVPHMPITNPKIKQFVQSIGYVHPTRRFEALRGMPVISFCCAPFLEDLAKLKRIGVGPTLWVNCMTFTFQKEKQAHRKGLIDVHLYQTDHAMKHITNILSLENPNIKAMKFTPYFNPKGFPFHTKRDENKFGFGRISRDDRSKYMSETLSIYDLIHAPHNKRAIILGYTKQKQRLTIGDVPTDPNNWLTAYAPCGITQQEFYKQCDCVVQTSTCNENFPRVGLEAMASGSILIVYNNVGWQTQVIHGETGFLCTSARDFVFYASHMAHHPELRDTMARNAFRHLRQVAGFEKSTESWKAVFDSIG